MKPKRTYKDSMFRDIFNNKKRLQSIYHALTGQVVPLKEIKITTLRGTFFEKEVFDMVSFKWNPEVAMKVRIDLDTLWDVLISDIPRLHEACRKIYETK